MNKAVSLRFTWLLFLTLPLSGCLPSLTAISIKDSEAFMPVLRASRNFQDAEDGGMLRAMEMEVSSASGKSAQSLSSWDYIQHGNDIIYGPAQVEASSNTSNAMLGVRGGWLREIVDIEWMGGLNILDSEIKLVSGNQSPSERLFSMGPYFGWKISLKPTQAVKLYGQGIVSTDFSRSDYGLLSGELGVSMNLDPNVELFVGWRGMNLNYAKQYASDINIDISGLTAGMQLAF